MPLVASVPQTSLSRLAPLPDYVVAERTLRQFERVSGDTVIVVGSVGSSLGAVWRRTYLADLPMRPFVEGHSRRRAVIVGSSVRHCCWRVGVGGRRLTDVAGHPNPS